AARAVVAAEAAVAHVLRRVDALAAAHDLGHRAHALPRDARRAGDGPAELVAPAAVVVVDGHVDAVASADHRDDAGVALRAAPAGGGVGRLGGRLVRGSALRGFVARR